MWTKLLENILDKTLRVGRISLHGPGDAPPRHFGPGQGGPIIALRIADEATARRIVLHPELGLGEAYVDGTLTIEGDDLHGFLELLARNRQAGGAHWIITGHLALQRLGRRIAQHNPLSRARANVAHHYDLSGDLYDLFLDADRNYSCAFFTDPGMTLEAAQAAKKRHIAGKLLLERGMHVLDIGCGWGSMALTLARDYGVRVTGVTLSKEQHAVATRRAEEAGLTDRVAFRLQDYRRVRETFDRVVSIGMFEHVGAPHYDEYFDQVAARLAPEGVALVHTIGRNSPPGVTSPWISKYIFPGGYIPALSEVMAPVERTGLWTTDVEVWRLHYAETLRHWHDRFMANLDAARSLYDARFCRMWRYYLVASEQSFRHHMHCVFQVQLATSRHAVPLTRDYLYAPSREARMAAE